MKEIIKIAWKNVWRNKKRSITVILAVVLGISAGVFSAGLLHGWVNQRVEMAIYTENGHLKLYNPDFLNNEEINNSILDSGLIRHFLEKDLSVKAYSQRVKLMTMATTSRGSTSLMLQGINKENEKKVSKLHTCIIQGTYFEDDISYPIVISDKSAEQLRIKNYVLTTEILDSLSNINIPESVVDKLKAVENVRFETDNKIKRELSSLLTKKEVAQYGQAILQASEQYRLRSKIVFTFIDKQGELITQTYKVCGIYNTSNDMYEQMNAFVLQSDLSSLAGLDKDEFHETGILLHENTSVENVQAKLKTTFPQLSVLTWKELAPDASMTAEYMNIYLFVIIGFILFALAFGIINTMLMAILERTKELGMLMAIGMNKKRVFSMIMMETVFLTMVGAITGILIGWLLVGITGKTGLDFSAFSEGFEAMGWSAIVYPTIDAFFFFSIVAMVIITGILSSVIPARKALKLNPVEAIRTEN